MYNHRMSAFREWAESRRLAPVEVDGRWYWLPDETPPALWWQVAGDGSFATEQEAWDAISPIFDQVISLFSSPTIEACAEAIDQHADGLEEVSKQRPYRVAAIIVRRLKPE